MQTPTPADLLVFEHAVDGLFNRSLKGRLDAATKEKLRTIGINLDRKLLPAYSLQVWSAALRVAVQALYPGVSLDEGFRLLGQETVDGITRTLIGKAIEGTARVIGPARLLRRSEKLLRSATNFTQVKLTELKPNHFELWLNEVAPSEHYYVGQFSAALRIAGVQGIHVDVKERKGNSANFRLTWT